MKSFVEYLGHFPVGDCLLGTYYRLGGLTKISHQNLKDVESVLKMLLHLLGAYHHNIPEETLSQSYPAVCLRLHEAVCGVTNTVDFYEIPALSAEIIRTVVALQPAVDSGGRGKEAGKSSVPTFSQRTLAATRAWLHRILKKNMFQETRSSVSLTYSEEIQVWRRLVEIDFPAEHGWKESLLGDLEGRLKQVPKLGDVRPGGHLVRSVQSRSNGLVTSSALRVAYSRAE
nr:E3 ubiquitin-protein ligase RNF213-like [Microcebus murinus]